MKVNLSIWDRLSQVVLVLLFLSALAGAFFWYLPLIQKNQRYRQQILELDGRIQEQERVARRLKAEIDAFQNDPRTLERLAREKLGWAKTNETVIRFEAPPRK